jgi:thioester reductase-like protein
MNIFLTGSTGLLGGELLVTLSKRDDINKIYCLIRSTTEKDAILRLEKIFNLHNDHFDKSKVSVILGDLADENLTARLTENKELKNIDVIIHSAANTSFSRIYDSLVEKINIHGLNKIVQWAKQLSNLSTFLYIGTATICGKDIKDKIIQEDFSPNIHANHLVKYTYTKMQGELLLQRELPAEKILIARPSIIMGDSRPIIPRSPVILWALETINTLRLCPFNEHSQLDIIPVDFAADAIVKLLFVKRNHRVYHISSGVGSSTTAIKTLSALEPFFKDLPAFKFIPNSYLQKLKLWSKGTINATNGLAEYSDYCSYWEKTFEDRSALRIIFAGLEPYIDFIELGHIFDNTRLLNDTGILPPVPAHEYILNSIDYIKNINILEGAYEP